MINWIRYALYRYYNWVPKTLNNKIGIAELATIDMYSRATLVEIGTVNIREAISILTSILAIDYSNTYAVGSTIIIRSLRLKYLHVWYNDNGYMMDTVILLEWFDLLKRVNKLYRLGLKSNNNNISYRNSKKIEPLIIEGSNILDVILHNK